ncbi:TlpA family protein disulfide reductase [Wenyingzhuangia sp. IMCC45533]
MKKNILTGILLLVVTCVFSQKKMPNVFLNTLNSKSINIIKESKKNKIVVLSFWATWCVSCVNELDAINDLYKSWQNKVDVKLIAISVDDSRTQKRIRPLVFGKDWRYDVLIDDNQVLKRALNISVIPHTIIIKDSKIVYRHTGYTPGYENDLLKKIISFSE